MADAKRLLINPGFSIALGTFSASNTGIAASGSAIEWIFQADQAMIISRVGFRYGARTGTPPTHRISLQGVDQASGIPDGVIKVSTGPCSGLFTPPANTSWDGTWR